MRWIWKRFVLSLAVALAFAVVATPGKAVTIQVDYGYDNGFFAPESPARATLVAAANFYSEILHDTFDAIPPATTSFTGSAGTVEWHWELSVPHPAGLGTLLFADGGVGENAIKLFVGSTTFTDNTLATGSTGQVSTAPYRLGPPKSAFLFAERGQINQINSLVNSTVTRRGETSGYVTWGGSISVDSDTDWHYDHTTPPTAGTVDLFTVLLHELAHVFGFGTSSDWDALVIESTGRFIGPTAMSLYKDSIPLATGNTHWSGAPGSPVFGDGNTQVALMTTGITTGIRRRLTSLDASALADIGWTVMPPGVPGDYNDDGVVNAADYTVWRNLVGQVANLAADGNYDGQTDWGDYQVWKNGFSTTSGEGTSIETQPGEVPEPSAVAMLAVVAALLLQRRQVNGRPASQPRAARQPENLLNSYRL